MEKQSADTASLMAKRTPTRTSFTRTWNEFTAEVTKPKVDFMLINRLKRQLADRFMTLERVDEDVDRYLQENEASEAEFTLEYDATVQ